MIPGKVTDYGDLIHVEQWLVKGRRYLLAWRIGAPRDTTPVDRVPGSAGSRTGKADTIMDLQADKQVPLSLTFTDELNNPVPAPADVTATFTVDDPSIINLTTTGPVTANAAAVGALGTATVHVALTLNGQSITGDLQIVVVSGDAERVEITPGDPTEVTPDTV